MAAQVAEQTDGSKLSHDPTASIPLAMNALQAAQTASGSGHADEAAKKRKEAAKLLKMAMDDMLILLNVELEPHVLAETLTHAADWWRNEHNFYTTASAIDHATTAADASGLMEELAKCYKDDKQAGRTMRFRQTQHKAAVSLAEMASREDLNEQLNQEAVLDAQLDEMEDEIRKLNWSLNVAASRVSHMQKALDTDRASGHDQLRFVQVTTSPTGETAVGTPESKSKITKTPDLQVKTDTLIQATSPAEGTDESTFTLADVETTSAFLKDIAERTKLLTTAVAF
eukprot:GDKI01037890.1.p1 GENE.GDKI01037890.1~~GDKI01037890.1.p1  ORF type:complete len:285 (-),score=47.47 GDKI01037890.1:145-999(-)